MYEAERRPREGGSQQPAPPVAPRGRPSGFTMSSSFSPNSSVAWSRIRPHLWPVGSVVLGTFILTLILTGSWPRAYMAEATLRLPAAEMRSGELDAAGVTNLMERDDNLSQAAADTGATDALDELRGRLSVSAETDAAGDLLARASYLADDPDLASAFVQRLGERSGERLRKAAIERARRELLAAHEAAAMAFAEKRQAEQTLQSFLEERAAATIARAARGQFGRAATSTASQVHLVSAHVPVAASSNTHQANHATYFEPATGAASHVALLGDVAIVGRGGVTLVETPLVQESLSRRQLEAEYGELARRKRQITEQHPHYGEIVARLVQLERMLAEQPGGIQPLPGPVVPRPNGIYATPLPAAQRQQPSRDARQLAPLQNAQGPGLIPPGTSSPLTPALAWTAENLEAYRHQVAEIKRLDEAYQTTLQAEQDAWRRQQAAETDEFFSMSPSAVRMELHPKRRGSWLMFALLTAGVMGAICAYLRRRALAVFVTSKDAAEFLPVPVLGTLSGAKHPAVSMPRMARAASGWMKPAGEISILGMVVWMLGMGILDSGYLHDLADDPLRGVAMCLAKTLGMAG